MLLAGRRQHQRSPAGHAEPGPGARATLRVAPSQPLGVAAPGDDLDAVARHVQPPRHDVGDMAADGVEADHPAGRGGVQQLGPPDLPAGDAGNHRLLGPVGDVDQAGHHRDPGQAGGDSAGHVGLEQRRVHQVRLPGSDQPAGPAHPAHAPASSGQGVQPRPGGLQLGLHPGPVMKKGDLQLDPAVDVARGHRRERTLGAGRRQAVDHVQDPHTRSVRAAAPDGGSTAVVFPVTACACCGGDAGQA